MQHISLLPLYTPFLPIKEYKEIWNNNHPWGINMKYRYPGLQKANKTLLNYITYAAFV